MKKIPVTRASKSDARVWFLSFILYNVKLGPWRMDQFGFFCYQQTNISWNTHIPRLDRESTCITAGDKRSLLFSLILEMPFTSNLTKYTFSWCPVQSIKSDEVYDSGDRFKWQFLEWYNSLNNPFSCIFFCFLQQFYHFSLFFVIRCFSTLQSYLVCSILLHMLSSAIIVYLVELDASSPPKLANIKHQSQLN